MTHKDFDEFLDRQLNIVRGVLCTKSSDYSSIDDKLYNFKLAAEMDGISPEEALRGMSLKHRASLRQGLDERIIICKNKPCLNPPPKPRTFEWWQEKITDSINYQLLLLALIKENE